MLLRPLTISEGTLRKRWFDSKKILKRPKRKQSCRKIHGPLNELDDLSWEFKTSVCDIYVTVIAFILPNEVSVMFLS